MTSAGRTMRVLVGVHEGGFTGIDTYAEQVAIAAASAGHEVTLLTSTPALGEQLHSRLSSGVNVIDLGLPPLTARRSMLIRFWPGFAMRRLARGLTDVRGRLPDRFPIAHLNHPGLAAAVRPYADRVCVAAWFYPHDPVKRVTETWHHTGRSGPRSLVLAGKSVSHYLNDASGYRQSDWVVAPTRLLADQLLDQGIAAAVCPPPARAVEQGTPVDRTGTEAAEILLLICAGDLSHPRKNVGAALRAVRLLPPMGRCIIVELIGRNGDLLRPAAAGMPEHVVIRNVGPLRQEQVHARMRASDALLFPSLYEEWGYVAVESMLCGAPVVTFPVYPFAEMISPGLGVQADDMTDAAFAHAIEQVFAEGRPPDLARMAAERFGSTAIGHRLTDIWQRAENA